MKYWIIINALVLCFTTCIARHILHPKFGCDPKGKRLERIQKSSNYKDGHFHNILPLKAYVPHAASKVLRKLAKRQGRSKVVIPSKKTDLHALRGDALVWFGHSSYFTQMSGNRIAVDPVLSEVSSPIPCFPRAFRGSNVYKPEEIPELDYVFITHDHWDHLDYNTITKLRFRYVICPLGVGEHLERFGIDPARIIEMDWNDNIEIDGFNIYCLTARHWSRRGRHQNKTLWASFLLETPSGFKVYIGGDGGYGPHFAEIGNRFGEIDLAILENGQYNKNWSQIHMHPQEVVQAAEDLKAKTLLPVHYAKFSLSTHNWNEPIARILKLAAGKHFRLITPMIGESVELTNPKQTFTQWWI
ncbi:MAG: MBL fold metallo-hydrolase [Holosporales bacterium]|jgi:L-ascorbate metabolism protein UlaG (beta-lactamase superfamily)|nr:MBL fold metallo-hydrolase [Holosporales bacterium]